MNARRLLALLFLGLLTSACGGGAADAERGGDAAAGGNPNAERDSRPAPDGAGPADAATGPADAATGPADAATGPADAASSPLDAASSPLDAASGPLDAASSPLEASAPPADAGGPEAGPGPDATPPGHDAAGPGPDAADPAPDAAVPPALPPLSPAALRSLAVDPAEWPDPVVDPGLPPLDPPEPEPSSYGHLPEGWEAAARARYGRGNIPRSLLQIGDSISESHAFIAAAADDPASGISAVEGYLHLPKELATMAGQESSWGASIIDGALDAARAETATILFGTNDARHGGELADFERNMRTIVQACIDRGTLPILLTQPPIDGELALVAPFSDAVRRISDDLQVPLFDLQTFLVDRGRLAQDMPDGLHPSLEAYTAFNAEWIRLYKFVEWHALRPERAAAPDPLAPDRALVWEQVYASDFSRPDALEGWTVGRGDWALVARPGDAASVAYTALVGRPERDQPGIIRLPVRVAGPVRVEIGAASDGGEISIITHNEGDEAGVQGWYYGFGTNGGARTGIVWEDALVAELPLEAPAPGRWYRLRAGKSPHFARWGRDGTYRLTYLLQGQVDGPERDGVGLYAYDRPIYVHHIVVWAGRAP